MYRNARLGIGQRSRRKSDEVKAVVMTLNRKRWDNQQLKIVYEWNPHARSRRLWWLWRVVTPPCIVNAWV